MSDLIQSPQLDADTRRRLRHQLTAERARILEVEGVSLDDLDDPDRLSDAVARALDEMSDRTLAEVADALLRMDSGTYGQCQVCGTAIPVERLEVMPATRHCVACQRAAE